MCTEEVISLIQVLIRLVTLSIDREELHSQLDGKSALYLQIAGCGLLVLDKMVKSAKFPGLA